MTRFIGPGEVLCALVLLGCNAVDGNAKHGNADAASEPAHDAGVSAAPDAGRRAALGKEFPCLGESSVHTKAGGNTRGPEPLCTNLNAEARCAGMKTQADADRTCDSDSDCVWATYVPSCVDHCYTGAIVSKAGAKVIADAVDELENDLCSRFDDAGCTYLASGCPLGAAFGPACVDGECMPVSACIVAPRRADELWAPQLPALADGCTTDDDCVVEHPTACSWSCPKEPAFIAKANAARYQQLTRSIEDVCQRMNFGSACDVPPCDPPPEIQAVCQDGTCVAR